jgi:hypothetical protein
MHHAVLESAGYPSRFFNDFKTFRILYGAINNGIVDTVSTHPLEFRLEKVIWRIVESLLELQSNHGSSVRSSSRVRIGEC